MRRRQGGMLWKVNAVPTRLLSSRQWDRERAGKRAAFKSLTLVIKASAKFFFLFFFLIWEGKFRGKRRKSYALNFTGALQAGIGEKGVAVIEIIIRQLSLESIHHFPLISRPSRGGFKRCWLTGLPNINLAEAQTFILRRVAGETKWVTWMKVKERKMLQIVVLKWYTQCKNMGVEEHFLQNELFHQHYAETLNQPRFIILPSNGLIGSWAQFSAFNVPFPPWWGYTPAPFLWWGILAFLSISL